MLTYIHIKLTVKGAVLIMDLSDIRFKRTPHRANPSFPSNLGVLEMHPSGLLVFLCICCFNNSPFCMWELY